MLLLDSSVLIWAISRSDRLGQRTRNRIESESVVHVSAVSVAELMINAMTGKLAIPDDLPQAIQNEGFAELPLTAAHAAMMSSFPELARHDPFDRLLVAQALSAGMDFLTADRVLLGLGRDFIVDASQ